MTVLNTIVAVSYTHLLRQWEGLRIQPDRHDNWWANFVRASTIRIAQIQQQDPAARITWIVYRPGYATRGKEDGKPYTRWIADLASKYKIRLVWVNSADQAIRALNSSPRFHGDKVESFYYFGHSNCYAWMLDYGNNIMAVSTEWIHETDLNRIRRDIFTPQSDCWSFGCYTGASMSRWWKRIEMCIRDREKQPGQDGEPRSPYNHHLPRMEPFPRGGTFIRS